MFFGDFSKTAHELCCAWFIPRSARQCFGNCNEKPLTYERDRNEWSRRIDNDRVALVRKRDAHRLRAYRTAGHEENAFGVIQLLHDRENDTGDFFVDLKITRLNS